MIRERILTDATNGNRIAWDGLAADPLPTDTLVLHPQTHAVFDERDGHTFQDVPRAGIAVPRTTWYADALHDVTIVGYLIGPDGCVPIFAPRSHDAHRSHQRAHPHDVGSPAPRQPRRNWRARKAARAAESPELAHPEPGGSGEPQ
jgi:hypothetical protein